ncbi:MAG: hypothetical protein ACYTG5_02500 [Planctomycetota bacterium]|jgi:hypothetical protein
MELNSEFMVSFDLVSALQAGYRAQFAALQVLDDHLDSSNPDLDLDHSQNIIQKVDAWSQMVWEGQLLCDRLGEESGSTDLKEAIQLTEELAEDLDDIAEEIDRGLALATDEPDADLYALLTAGLVRNAFANLHNLQISIEFARLVQHEELAARYEAVHPEVTGMVEQAKARTRALQDADDDQLSWDILKIQAASLPGVFRGMRNDLNHLLATLRDEYDVEDYGLSQVEWLNWEDEGFDAFSAGAWKAFGFNVDQASNWVNSSGCDPRLANEWRSRCFGVSSAFHWSMSGFTPEGAACWQTLAGTDVGEAAAWREQGSSLDTARRWRELGYDVEDARIWALAGIDNPTDVLIFQNRGIDEATEALAWTQQGIEILAEIMAWKNLGLSPEDAGGLQRAGHDPESAERVLNDARH